MAHTSDQDRIENTHNVPRFFVEHPQVSWVLLVGVLVWGWFGYHSMPQRKDPDIPVRVAVAACAWPGATAQQVEQFVTRPIEDAAALMLTIASPKADSVEIEIRARGIQSAIYTSRAAKKYKKQDAPITIVYSFPQSLSSNKTIL